MWIVITNKDGLLRHLAANKRDDAPRGIMQQSWQSSRLGAGEIAMLWESPPRSRNSLPEVIVVQDGELRSFLAWTSTYLDGFRPFTSLCRVLEAHTFEAVREAEPFNTFGEVGPACAAIILADALTQGAGRVDESSITIAACESTYSFVRSRFLASGIRDDVRMLQKRWSLARDVGRQPRRRLSPDSAEPLWSLIEAFAGNLRSDHHSRSEIALLYLSKNYIRTGTLSISDLESIAMPRARVGELVEVMTESRELRVTALNDALRGPALRGLSGVEGDFFRGYIASLLSPGTMEYLSFVSSFLDQYPMLLMWYAFFAGLHPESKVLSQFGGLCRRLLKDIEQRDLLFERPRCDIAVDELEVLSATGPAGLTYIRGGSQGTVRVELYPTITAPVRVITEADQPSLFHESPRDQDRRGEKTLTIEQTDIVSAIATAISILGKTYARLRDEGLPDQGADNEKRKRGRRK